jgi:hypothetical protein
MASQEGYQKRGVRDPSQTPFLFLGYELFRTVTKRKVLVYIPRETYCLYGPRHMCQLWKGANLARDRILLHDTGMREFWETVLLSLRP